MCVSCPKTDYLLALTKHRVELDVPVRLRRAILQNDVLLVKRIVKNNRRCLENPDFADKSNTSLHLAAIKGHVDIVVSFLFRVLNALYK